MLTALILGLILLFALLAGMLFVGALLVELCVGSSVESGKADQNASGKALKEDELSEKEKENLRLAQYLASVCMFDPLSPWYSGPFLF